MTNKLDRNQLVKLMIDTRKGKVNGNFSMDESMDVIRKAFLDMNGNKIAIDPQDVIFGRCNEMFEVIREVVNVVHHDILTTDPFFMQFVEYRNLALGDKNEFVLPNKDPFIVSEIADGTQALRRQRIMGGTTYSVTTTTKGVKAYEEMNMLLAGRVSWLDVVDRIEKGIREQIINDIYNVWNGSITGLDVPYAKTGAFTEADMLTLIQHVEAANGTNNAYIMGTRVALNKVTASYESTAQVALESKYYNGFCGLFNGIPKIETINLYKPGTTTFLLSDNVVNVFAGNVKPIMYVNEGNTLVLPNAGLNNLDLTQEQTIIYKSGCSARLNGGEGMFGRYTISA